MMSLRKEQTRDDATIGSCVLLSNIYDKSFCALAQDLTMFHDAAMTHEDPADFYTLVVYYYALLKRMPDLPLGDSELLMVVAVYIDKMQSDFSYLWVQLTEQVIDEETLEKSEWLLLPYLCKLPSLLQEEHILELKQAVQMLAPTARVLYSQVPLRH